MCIAILLPKYKTIDKETLNRCNRVNPDGFGYAFFDINNKLVIKKEVDETKIENSIKKFLDVRLKYIDKPFLVHFRIATHGKISNRCCHPFKINKNMVFCHNGILGYDYGVDITSTDSDTMMFNKNILQKLSYNSLDKMIKGKNQVLKDLLEGYIGSRNKMILLNKDGEFTILNEKAGIWDKGVWYSNSGYKKVKIPKFSFWNGQYWDNKQGVWKNWNDWGV